MLVRATMCATSASARRAGTTRRAKARGTASSIRRREAGRRASTSCAFYAEHFDTVEVNSTFYGQPRAEVTRGWAERTPAGFEFSVKLYQKFTHPRMFEERVERSLPAMRAATRTLLEALAQPERGATSTSSGAASIRSRRRGQAGRAARAVSAELQGHAGSRATTSPGCCARSRDYPVAVELRHRSWSDAHRRHAGAAERVRRRVGADRRAEVPLLDPAELPAERRGLLLHAAARPERGAVVAPRQGRGPLQLPLLGRRAAGVRGHGRRRAAAREEGRISTRTITSRRSRSPTPR